MPPVSVGTAAEDLRRPAAPAARARALLADPVIAAVVALTLLATVARFYRLGHQGFWFDEANTAQLVHFSPGKMLGLIPQTESTPPLYYCVAWVWARVFGYDEASLRSLSAVCGVLLVPVVYASGAKLVSRRAGLIAAALAACSPLLIWYSQEARSYQMLALFSAVSLLAFAYARVSPTPRVLAAWVAACALALATHYYAVLAVVPEAIWLLVVHRRSARRPDRLRRRRPVRSRTDSARDQPARDRQGQLDFAVPVLAAARSARAAVRERVRRTGARRVRAGGDRDRARCARAARHAVGGGAAPGRSASGRARAGGVRAQPGPGRRRL